MNKIIKNALVLMAFSLVLGFVLGAVYKITEGPIAEATRRKEMEAYKVVFEDAEDFAELEVDPATADMPTDVINKVFIAVDADGNTLGHVVQLTTKDGYSGGIVMVVGIRLDGTVNGFSVTAHSETSGLGTKAFDDDEKSDEDFCDNFKGIPAADVSGVSTISGATLTSTAVINGINAAVEYVNIIGGAQ